MTNFIKDSSFNVLYTDDVLKTREFFDVIGGEIKEFSEEKVVVKIGSFDLHYILASTEPFKEYEYIAEDKNPGQGIIFYIEVDDLNNLYQKLSKNSVSIKSEILENHWSCKEFLCEDPNGYKFAFYSC